MVLKLMNDSVEIQEYKTSNEVVLDSKDRAFINNINRKQELLGIQVLENNFKFKANSYVGVIQLPSGLRIQIEPKIDKIKLLYIFSYLCDIDYIHENETKYRDGDVFLDIIALLFKKEVEKILEQGILKKYVSREENINYLKGKLLIKQQISLNFINKNKFYCNFDEHTFDILENRIMLYALNLLIQLVHDSNLRIELSELKTILETSISREKIISKHEIDSIIFDRLNDYYIRMLSIARLIINQNYLQDLSTGEVSAFCFLVDMNKVFENYIFKLFTEAFRQEKIIIGQKRAKNLLEGTPKRTIKPDIIVTDLNDEMEFVIDTKYKKDVVNSDLYQVIAYGLAHSVNSILIYPHRSEEQLPNKYKINHVENNDNILIRFFNLECENCNDFKGYIASQKEQIKNLYNSCKTDVGIDSQDY